MSALTRYAQKQLLDHILTKAVAAVPPGCYLALFTTDPGEDGSTAGELVGGGYSRLSLPANMSATDLSTGQAVNTALMLLGPATANWNSASYFGIMDAPIGGNMWIYAPLVTTMIVLVGDSPPIPEASLIIRLQ